jgi:hypothetical protein
MNCVYADLFKSFLYVGITKAEKEEMKRFNSDRWWRKPLTHRAMS